MVQEGQQKKNQESCNAKFNLKKAVEAQLEGNYLLLTYSHLDRAKRQHKCPTCECIVLHRDAKDRDKHYYGFANTIGSISMWRVQYR